MGYVVVDTNAIPNIPELANKVDKTCDTLVIPKYAWEKEWGVKVKGYGLLLPHKIEDSNKRHFHDIRAEFTKHGIKVLYPEDYPGNML